jgi:hypothetical protein
MDEKSILASNPAHPAGIECCGTIGRMTSLRTMDLNLPRALDALLDERNVTHAAARLAPTQPAMSGILQRRRENFGDPLFVRAQRGIVPTARALALVAPMKSILCSSRARRP